MSLSLSIRPAIVYFRISFLNERGIANNTWYITVYIIIYSSVIPAKPIFYKKSNIDNTPERIIVLRCVYKVPIYPIAPEINQEALTLFLPFLVHPEILHLEADQC